MLINEIIFLFKSVVLVSYAMLIVICPYYGLYLLHMQSMFMLVDLYMPQHGFQSNDFYGCSGLSSSFEGWPLKGWMYYY
jgi:hypothetical protein